MNDNLLKSQTFKLKGRLYTLTVMQVLSHDLAAFERQLLDAIAKAPRLLQQIPVVLDCSQLQDESFDLQAFCTCLRTHQVLPIAVQGASAWLATMAQCHGLAVLNSSASLDKALTETVAEAPKSTSQKTNCHTQPVRSGQQLVARGGDLLVLASVSPGAEVLADGHIHIYGALRGRALAGISGDKNARIFCQSLAAELVSIAGVYRLNDQEDMTQGPCQIFLKGDKIVVEPLVFGVS